MAAGRAHRRHGQHTRHNVIYSGVDGYTPWRDRRVNARVVRCPACGAEPGNPCVSAKGAPTGSHRPRRAFALRKEREEQNTTKEVP